MRATKAAQSAEALEAQGRHLLRQAAQARLAAKRINLGNEGEQVIGGLLDRLVPDGWRVLHDRRKQPGSPANLDHVLIGPPGVFVVDAKNWTGGRLRCDDRGMAVGRWRKDDELHSAKVDADIVGRHVQTLLPHAQTVGVIAFAQDMGLPGPLSHQRVLLVQHEHLLDALRRLPMALTAQQVADVTAALDHQLTARLAGRRTRSSARAAAASPPPGRPPDATRSAAATALPQATAAAVAPGPPAPPTLSAAERRRVQARTKARRQLKLGAIKLVVLAACLPAAPWVIEHVVGAVGPHIIDQLTPPTSTPPAGTTAPATSPR